MYFFNFSEILKKVHKEYGFVLDFNIKLKIYLQIYKKKFNNHSLFSLALVLKQNGISVNKEWNKKEFINCIICNNISINNDYPIFYNFLIFKIIDTIKMKFTDDINFYHWSSSICIQSNTDIIAVLEEGDLIKTLERCFRIQMCIHDEDTDTISVVIQNIENPDDTQEYKIDDFLLLFNNYTVSYTPSSCI